MVLRLPVLDFLSDDTIDSIQVFVVGVIAEFVLDVGDDE